MNRNHHHLSKNAIWIITCLVFVVMSATIDLQYLHKYARLPFPKYITRDNTPLINHISDTGATLGRVLFYDKNLSINNSISCASCHIQQFAFGDTAKLSVGHDGKLTGRHAMRLVIPRFGGERKFFWNERAASLEALTTQPIRDHIELGFSGIDGKPDFDSLLRKLADIPYYPVLFEATFGTPIITEAKIQRVLAQFIRSIQSFDSKYDAGRAIVNEDTTDFPNFNAEENLGKLLYMTPPSLGGAGCFGCHPAPEFDIMSNSENNGVITKVGLESTIDIDNTRSPSLRDLVNPNGKNNGPYMHNGELKTIEDVIEHYNEVKEVPGNTRLDKRLIGHDGKPQKLNLTKQEKAALVAFLKTLTSKAMYNDVRWSDPFNPDGSLGLNPITSNKKRYSEIVAIHIYPNPATDYMTIASKGHEISSIYIYNAQGKLMRQINGEETNPIDITNLPIGKYYVKIKLATNQITYTRSFIKL